MCIRDRWIPKTLRQNIGKPRCEPSRETNWNVKRRKRRCSLLLRKTGWFLPSPYFGKMDHRKYWYWNHRIWSCWEERAQLWTSEFVLKIMPTINSVWWDAVRFAKQAVVWQHWFGWMAKWLTQRSAKPLFVGLNPTSTSEIRNNDRSTRKGSGNSVQAAHIAEIAHRQSVGIPAKEWGSIPCFRSNDTVAEQRETLLSSMVMV